MPKKTKITPEELELFHRAMEGVKPLKHKKIRVTKPSVTKKIIKQSEHDDDEGFSFIEHHDVDDVTGEEFIAFRQAGISNKTLRKLRKGQYNVEAILDLHGMHVEEAKFAVESFLQQCLSKGMRVALIIHGKGHHSQMPILKNKLNHWLRKIDVILAFCSAAPGHGSRGAIYVLLKRVVEENRFE